MGSKSFRVRLLLAVIALSLITAVCARLRERYDDLFAQPPKISAPERVGADIYQFHFVHFVRNEGEIYGYFIDHSNRVENEVGLAISSDGLNFRYEGKVIRRKEWYDAGQASFPSVQIRDGRWYMLYEGRSHDEDINSIILAESDDGRRWKKIGPVIRPDYPGAARLMPGVPTPGPSIAALDVGTPTFFYLDGLWRVYFHATDKNHRVRIGYASGKTLDNLSVSAEPILDIQPSGNETGTVGWRSNLVLIGGLYYMAYEWATDPFSHEPEGYQNSWWGISLARAENPEGPWEKSPFNPLLINPETGFGFDGPELLLIDDWLYLYYRGKDNTTWRVRFE